VNQRCYREKLTITPMQSLPKQEEPIEKKKRHRLRTTIIILVIVLVILPLCVLGWTGIYNIPVVTAVFGSNKPIDLDVHPTAADLAKAEAANPVKVNVTPGTLQWTRNKVFTGSVPINTDTTSAETTAMIEKYHGEGEHVRDIQVKYREGGMEISAFVVPYIKAPVYVDIDVAKASATSVSLNLKKAKVGRLTVPEQYYDDITRAAERIVNQELAKITGLTIGVLDYHDGYAHREGTLPASVSLGEGSQTLESLLD
jgi:hypothetical protein